jgi:MOB kinase activator 1
MNAGPKYEYHWSDHGTMKKPLKVSAPEYVEFLMTWIQTQIDDEAVFPQKVGSSFSKGFVDKGKIIAKRLFRVYAHIYHEHFDRIVGLQEEAHLNTR